MKGYLIVFGDSTPPLTVLAESSDHARTLVDVADQPWIVSITAMEAE